MRGKRACAVGSDIAAGSRAARAPLTAQTRGAIGTHELLVLSAEQVSADAESASGSRLHEPRLGRDCSHANAFVRACRG
jgi:hypothetical protein